MSCRFDIDKLEEAYEREVCGFAARKWIGEEELYDRAYIGRQVAWRVDRADLATLTELREVAGDPEQCFRPPGVNPTLDGFCYLKWLPIEYWDYIAGQIGFNPGKERLSAVLGVFGLEHLVRVERYERVDGDLEVHALELGSIDGFRLSDCAEVVQVGMPVGSGDTTHSEHGATFAATGYGEASIAGCDGDCGPFSECLFVHVRDHVLRGCVKHGLPVVALESHSFSREDRQFARDVANFFSHGRKFATQVHRGIPVDRYLQCVRVCVFPFLRAVSSIRKRQIEMNSGYYDSDEEYGGNPSIPLDERIYRNITFDKPPTLAGLLGRDVNQAGKVPRGLAGKVHPVEHPRDRLGLRDIVVGILGSWERPEDPWQIFGLAYLHPRGNLNNNPDPPAGVTASVVSSRRAMYAGRGQDSYRQWLEFRFKFPPDKEVRVDEDWIRIVFTTSKFSILDMEGWTRQQVLDTFYVLLRGFWVVEGYPGISKFAEGIGLVGEKFSRLDSSFEGLILSDDDDD